MRAAILWLIYTRFAMLYVSAATIDKRIVPAIICDAQAFQESTITIVPVDQNSEKRFEKHAEGMIVPKTPKHSRDLLEDYTTGAAWQHLLYKRAQLEVPADQNLGVSIIKSILTPFSYEPFASGPTFKFFKCKSKIMGYPEEDHGDVHKVIYGHLSPSSNIDRCVSATKLIKRNQRYSISDCSQSDDSGQFLQWWRLDEKVESQEDGTKLKTHWLTFLGKPKTSTAPGEYSTLLLKGNSTMQTFELALDYKTDKDDMLQNSELAYLSFGSSKWGASK